MVAARVQSVIGLERRWCGGIVASRRPAGSCTPGRLGRRSRHVTRVPSPGALLPEPRGACPAHAGASAFGLRGHCGTPGERTAHYPITAQHRDRTKGARARF